MKKVLLGTTALIAATFASQAARADDQPVKLSISGIAQFAYGVAVSEKEHSNNGGGSISQISSDHLPDSAKTYTNLDISGDAKFKNGLTAGAFIEFSAQPNASGSNGTTGTTQIKQDWVHIKGDSFGEVRMGDFTDARRINGLAAPSWSPNYFLTGNSPDIAFIGSGAGSNTTTAYFGNRFMTEIAYFSPTFDGATLVLSYAPDNGTFSSAGPGSAVTTASGNYAQNNTAFGSKTFIRDIFSGALSWSGTFSGFTINADVGLTTGSAKKNNVFYAANVNGNPFAFDGGANVTYGPWTVGAAYEQTSNLMGGYGAGLNAEQVDKTLDVGFTYTIGNLTTGVEWSRGIYEGGLAAAGLGAAGNTSADPKSHFTLDTVTPGASYVIGPGVDIDAGVAYNVAHGNGYDAAAYTGSFSGAGQTRGQDIVLEFGTEVKF